MPDLAISEVEFGGETGVIAVVRRSHEPRFLWMRCSNDRRYADGHAGHVGHPGIEVESPPLRLLAERQVDLIADPVEAQSAGDVSRREDDAEAGRESDGIVLAVEDLEAVVEQHVAETKVPATQVEGSGRGRS